jgi:hypothetical protein
MKTAPQMYLTLSADGVEDIDQRSRTRKAFMLAAALLVLATPLVWTVGAQGSADTGPNAVVNKPIASASDDDDDDGDDTTGGGGAGGTSTDRTLGDRFDSQTRGDTNGARDRATGRETGGYTDGPGRYTGVSTAGETDPGDRTGVTERR